jgi:elongation factor Ts
MYSIFYLFRRKKKKGKDDEYKSERIKKKDSPVDIDPMMNVSSISNIINKSEIKNMITTEQIKELRDMTGVSIMLCKKALEEAQGDTEKALVILRKSSGAIAQKKADRTFNAGTIQSYVHSNGNIAVLVELNTETDFVANHVDFIALAKDIAMHVAATNPKFLKKEDITEEDMKSAKEVFENEVKDKPEAMRAKILEGKLATYFGEMVLLDQPFVKDPSKKIVDLINEATQKFGEKIAVGRYVRYKVLER